MKQDNKLLRGIATLLVAFGVMSYAGQATQYSKEHIAKMPGTTLKTFATHAHIEPGKVIPRLNHTDTEALYHVARTGDMEKFARDYANAAAIAIEHYYHTNIHANAHGNADPLLTPTAANRANAGLDVNVHALITNAGLPPALNAPYLVAGGWGQVVGGPGGVVAAGAGLQELDMPADLTHKAFFDALKHRMQTVAIAELHNIAALQPTGDFVLPAKVTTQFKIQVREAIKQDIDRWLTAMETGGAAIFVGGANGVRNTANVTALRHVDIAAINTDVPGIAGSSVAIPSPAVPADLRAASIAARFAAVVDLVDLFG